MRPMLALIAASAIVSATCHAAPQSSPVVVELFTSEGCSSCPPADTFLRDLSRRPDVLALSFHVTYWNDLGWVDPYSFQAATERQREYARAAGDGEVYTPEMVVAGGHGFVGSDRREGLRAIAEAAAAAPTVPVQLRRDGAGLLIALGAGAARGKVLLVGFDPEQQTHIGRGENGGLDLREADIVRSLAVAGRWTGAPLVLRRPLPAGQQAAVLVQQEDGRIVGAARLPLAQGAS